MEICKIIAVLRRKTAKHSPSFLLYNARMRLVISHRSALDVCSRLAAAGERVARACKLRSLRECASAEKDVFGFDLSSLPVPPDSKIDILVPNTSNRFVSKSVCRHIWNGSLPDGALYRVAEDVYVTGPEFSLLLLSKGTPFNELIMLCSEVCGRYALERGDRGFFDRPALSSVSKINAFLDKVGSESGVAKLRRALRYAVDNSRSPMESALATIMALPTRCGGFGFPKPTMNHRFHLSMEAARVAGRQYVEFDLFFPDCNLGIEYDSRQYHVNDERFESDARRNNTLRHLGFSIVNITRRQVQDPVVFVGIMAQVASELGKPNNVSESGLAKREALRAELFPFWNDYQNCQ